jgi:hypothetical protein
MPGLAPGSKHAVRLTLVAHLAAMRHLDVSMRSLLVTHAAPR